FKLPYSTGVYLLSLHDALPIYGFIAEKVLVVAPLRVANSVWKQESEKWQHLKHLKVSVCTGTEKQRIAALFQTADVYVINRENIDRKSTRLNSSHVSISYAVFC